LSVEIDIIIGISLSLIAAQRYDTSDHASWDLHTNFILTQSSTVKPILRGHLLNKEKVTLLDRLPLKRGSVRMKFSGKEKGDLLILMTA
jgi:hypothetical protein